MIRHDWKLEQLEEIYNRPVLDLLFQAQMLHREYHPSNKVQVCNLISIKTGGCPEDCSYCPQAARYQTNLKIEGLLEVGEVLERSQKAKADGASRVCLGAAWREVKDNKDFDQVISMVKGVSDLGMEVCCTLGMLNDEQAKRLKEAGLFAYNHNLDTSEEYYEEIISTRNYDDRIKTIENVREAKISVCSGGIIGMGESVQDRLNMLQRLSSFYPHPDSVPINALVAVEGTPLENQQPVSIWEMVRMIATARLVLPKSMVRLSAGRVNMSAQDQALCFMAGANSIFSGEKLLTTPNPQYVEDRKLFDLLGLERYEPYESVQNG